MTAFSAHSGLPPSPPVPAAGDPRASGRQSPPLQRAPARLASSPHLRSRVQTPWRCAAGSLRPLQPEVKELIFALSPPRNELSVEEPSGEHHRSQPRDERDAV